MLHWISTNTPALDTDSDFVNPSITYAYILSSENCFGSDMNQCTSQVNPGEIEIHLQTSDHNQTARRQVYLNFKKHWAMAQWGTSVEGKAAEITSQTLQASPREVLAVLRKEHMGMNSEN